MGEHDMKLLISTSDKEITVTANEEKLREFEYQFLEALKLRQKAIDPKVFKKKAGGYQEK
jgi:hypothetical protein